MYGAISLGLGEETLVQFYHMVTNEPHQVGEEWCSRLVAHILQHLTVIHCNQNYYNNYCTITSHGTRTFVNIKS